MRIWYSQTLLDSNNKERNKRKHLIYYPWNQHVHGCNCLSIIILSHVECLNILKMLNSTTSVHLFSSLSLSLSLSVWSKQKEDKTEGISFYYLFSLLLFLFFLEARMNIIVWQQVTYNSFFSAISFQLWDFTACLSSWKFLFFPLHCHPHKSKFTMPSSIIFHMSRNWIEHSDVQKWREKVACLWIVSDYNRASTKYLFSYITLMFTLQITTPFHLWSDVENYVKYNNLEALNK